VSWLDVDKNELACRWKAFLADAMEVVPHLMLDALPAILFLPQPFPSTAERSE